VGGQIWNGGYKGNLLKSVGDWEEAVDCWIKAIERDPMDSVPRNNLGYYYSEVKKDYQKAEQPELPLA